MAKQQTIQERNWYVIHTYSGYEDAVARSVKQRVESLDMEDKIFEVLVPKEKKMRIKWIKNASFYDRYLHPVRADIPQFERDLRLRVTADQPKRFPGQVDMLLHSLDERLAGGGRVGPVPQVKGGMPGDPGEIPVRRLAFQNPFRL